MKRVWLLGGGGDTGLRLAQRLEGTCELIATSRDPGEFDAPGRIVPWDPGNQPFSHLLDQHGSPDVVVNLIGAWLVGARHALVEITRDVTESLAPETRYVHCSAVSVWGSRPGEAVDESAPTFAEQRVAGLHLEAEEAVNDANERGVDGVVLRLPHIYGPGRERTVTLMRNGRFVILGNGRNRMHHLHVDDFVEVLANVILRDEVPSSLYAVVDDDDGTYGDYCDFVTAATGATPLPFMSLTAALEGELQTVLGPHFSNRDVVTEFWRFMTSDLRVDNSRMKQELDVELMYPTFREGLPGVIDADLEPAEEGVNVLDTTYESMIWAIEANDQLTTVAEPVDLLARVADGATMQVHAFESPSIRWGRVALMKSPRMLNLNVVVFPEVATHAPVLGLEFACTPNGELSFGAFDMWGAVPDVFAAKRDDSRAVVANTIPVEGRLAALLTPDAVAFRGDADLDEVLAASRELFKQYLDLLPEAESRAPEAGTSEQRQLCQKLLGRPGGRDHLAALFGGEWADAFLARVYYPEPG